ncbi:hypothetical protein K443DRAFT_107688, partial [Laccaria amethystina LaAM-08-1]
IPVPTSQDRFILTSPVFCSLGLVWLQSFSSYETGLPNTRILLILHRSLLQVPIWRISLMLCPL